MYSFFGLTCFSLHNYFEISLCSCVSQWFLSSYLWVILPCVNVPVCLHVCLSRNIWVVSSFWPLQTNLPWTLVYKSLDTYLHFFFLDKYWRMKWLTHMTGVCVCLRDCYAVFPLQYSCLENPLDGGTWWAMVHLVAKSWTWLSNFTFTFHFHALEKEMATHSGVLA